MVDRKAELYVPAVASFKGDLETRHTLLEPARQEGFLTGLMLVVREPSDLKLSSVRKQLDNLDPYVKKSTEERPVVFLMHPNMPIDKFNFFKDPEFSQDYVEQSIAFASMLPQEMRPKTGNAVSFHLNTLVTPAEWVADPDYWQKAFETVEAKIKSLVEYGARYGVKIAIETTPISEFGDIRRDKEHQLSDGTHWSDLGNPWPLLPWRDEIVKLRQVGSGLAIDWCHSYVALGAVEEVKKLTTKGKGEEAKAAYMVFDGDLKNPDLRKNFADVVLGMTQPGDIWHINDAKGVHRKYELSHVRTYFQEGVSLGKGDIPQSQQDRLLREGVNLPIKMVIEVHEKKDEFEKSPNTKASLQTLLSRL